MCIGGVDEYFRESCFELFSYCYWLDGDLDCIWLWIWCQLVIFYCGEEDSGFYWFWCFIGELFGDLCLYELLLWILCSDDWGILVDDESGDMCLCLIDVDVDGQGFYEVCWYYLLVVDVGSF